MTGSERGRSRSPGRGPILRSNSDLQPNKRTRPSGIPVRTLTPNPTIQKLKPCPELTSPRKVIQTSHQISLKVQMERGNLSPPQKKPRAPALKRTTEKTGPAALKKKVTKVVKIDVDGRTGGRSGDKSPSRHLACLSPTPKKPVPPTKIESHQEPPVKGSTKKVTTCPALAPYLQQTQRVSRSIFLLEHSPLVPRPTFTSMLRESLRKSPRFLQLHSLYRSLDRLGELEKSTCPFLRMERELDFEAWWEGRRRRKEESEIQMLSSILREAQAKKEFFFQPTSATRVRWSWESDPGLRTKQWTIEEIKSSFAHRAAGPPTYPSDLYKTGWRGISVRELGLNLEVASLSKSKFQFYDPTARHGWLRRAFSMTSTLSPKERENISKQLGDLIQKSGEKDEKRRGETIGGVVRGRMGHTLSSDPYRPASASRLTWDGALSESEKKAISRSLSQEIQDKGRSGILQRKFLKKESSLPPPKGMGMERCRSVSPGGMGGEDRSRSHLNILTKLAAIVLRNDPGFQRALRRELREEVYSSSPKAGREVERLKGHFETSPHFSSQPNLSRLHPSSPDAYANWRRSRKPIYDPSSTPNICQPTLTPHCSPSLQQSPPLFGNWKIDPSLHRPVSRYVPPPPPYTQTHYGTYPRGRRGDSFSRYFYYGIV